MLRDISLWEVASKERRQYHHLKVRLPADLLSAALGRVHATVIDFSQAGCRIRTRARCHRGDRLVLTIRGLGPQAVQAAWRGDDNVGLLFAEPLSWAVVMQLAKIAGNAGGQPAATWPLASPRANDAHSPRVRPSPLLL